MAWVRRSAMVVSTFKLMPIVIFRSMFISWPVSSEIIILGVKYVSKRLAIVSILLLLEYYKIYHLVSGIRWRLGGCFL